MSKTASGTLQYVLTSKESGWGHVGEEKSHHQTRLELEDRGSIRNRDGWRCVLSGTPPPLYDVSENSDREMVSIHTPIIYTNVGIQVGM